LGYEPAKRFVTQYVRGIYACRSCETVAETAPLPERPAERVRPGASVLHSDDTPVVVQDNARGGGRQQCYLWLYPASLTTRRTSRVSAAFRDSADARCAAFTSIRSPRDAGPPRFGPDSARRTDRRPRLDFSDGLRPAT